MWGWMVSENIVFQCSCFNALFVSRERKHRVTMLVLNHQKHLSEPKLHFPWSYGEHSYVPLLLGKFQYPLTSATLGLSKRLQTCSSAIRNNYQRDSSVGLNFGRSVRRYCIFSEDNVRIMLDRYTHFILAPNFVYPVGIKCNLTDLFK